MSAWGQGRLANKAQRLPQPHGADTLACWSTCICISCCYFALSDLGLIIGQTVSTLASPSSEEGEGWVSLGSREEVNNLLSTGGQAPWGGAMLRVWRPHHVAAAFLPKPGPVPVPEFTAPPAGRLSQKPPVGSPNPTFLHFDPGWGLALWTPIFKSKVSPESLGSMKSKLGWSWRAGASRIKFSRLLGL